MRIRKILFTAFLSALLMFACACAAGGGSIPAAKGPLVITFDFARQSGYASNQFAVWIEDDSGSFVRTLYATHFTANGGYKNRPDSIPRWVERSGLAEKEKADAATGATPKSGSLSFGWDLTDENGTAVQPGVYRFFVEGSLRWKNRVLYSGTVTVGDSFDYTVSAESEFIYEGSEDQPALTEASPENGMIGEVTAVYTPVG